jgi:hypothetical protein
MFFFTHICLLLLTATPTLIFRFIFQNAGKKQIIVSLHNCTSVTKLANFVCVCVCVCFFLSNTSMKMAEKDWNMEAYYMIVYFCVCCAFVGINIVKL